MGCTYTRFCVSSFKESEEEGAPSSRSSRASSAGDDEERERYYYVEQITGMKDFELTTLYVDFAHLNAAENVLARAIAEQYYRCVQLAEPLMIVYYTKPRFCAISQIPSIPTHSLTKPSQEVCT